MNIVFRSSVKDVRAKPFDNSVPFLDDRIGFWGDVAAVNSEACTCDVLSDTGFTFSNIPVATKEWITPKSIAVKTYTDRDYSTVERNLPPIGARVFVFMPTHTITGAFVLCSGYTYGDTETHTLFEADKENVKEVKTQGGWTENEYYANGNRSITSNDGNIAIEINPVEDSTNSKEKKVYLKAWNNEITITEDGITLTIPKDCNLTIQGDANITVSGDCALTANTFNVNSGNLEVTS